MNKASLDKFEAASGTYRRNIFEATNPEVIRGLGDVGNDIKVYGSKLYIVVNISNKVEVLDLKTARRINKIDIQNCRYITFDAGKAYVSSYYRVINCITLSRIIPVEAVYISQVIVYPDIAGSNVEDLFYTIGMGIDNKEVGRAAVIVAAGTHIKVAVYVTRPWQRAISLRMERKRVLPSHSA